MQSAVIDRVVDGITAVLLVGEEQKQFLCPLHDLPRGSREGLWLLVRLSRGRLIQAELDEEKTKEIQERIGAKLENLRRRGRHGPEGS